jgi:periplasmic copper chaperone A
MNVTITRALVRTISVGAILLLPRLASAQVGLTEKTFQPGVNFAAIFELKHGCGASPTIALRIEIPDGVGIVETPPLPGWKVEIEPKPVAVTWRGKLDASKPERFGLLLKLPMRTGPLYFPAVQRCQSGEVRWTDVPVSNRAAPAHPAPVLVLGPAGDMTAMAKMPGMAIPAKAVSPSGAVTISDAWIRSLPGGVPLAGYFRAHNAGSKPVTVISAQSVACGMLMLHRTMKMAGRADMEQMATVDIPPRGDVVFEPGGYHLMCTKPAASMKPGDRISVTFFFADGAKTEGEFSVRDARGK